MGIACRLEEPLIDFLDIVELAFGPEEEFGPLPDGQDVQFKTVGDIIRWIQRSRRRFSD